VLLGRDKVTRDWLAWGKAWAQTDVLERRKDIVAELMDFKADGDLVVCEDPTQDIEEVAALLATINALGLLPEEGAIGLDPQLVDALVDALQAASLTDKQLVAVAQGFRLSRHVWGAERKLKDGTLRHGGQRLMNWCIGNAKVEQRGNAVLITKQVAGRAKIDPLMALFDAVSLMGRNPMSMGAQASPWDDPAYSLVA
jgi:phage terminase large subunit-like protein